MRRKNSARHAKTMTGERVLGKNRGHYTSIKELAATAIAIIVAMVGIEVLLQLAYIVQAARHGWGA